jgi:two-component system phosphate regulon sensor histidine kinase PhoR
MRVRATLFLSIVLVAFASSAAALGTLALLPGVGDAERGPRELLLALAAAMVVAALASALVAHVGASRAGALLSGARRYAADDYAARLRVTTSDELGEAARLLDETVQRLRISLAALTRDRARMQAILGGMVEGVLAVDELGVVQLANDAARRTLRFAVEPVGRRYLELIRHPDIEALISRSLRGEPTEAQELALAQEPVQTIIARTAPVVTADSRGVVLVLHDITELRRADRVRRDFVANVSHELRTPLTAIRGYVEALLDGPPADPETGRFLEIIGRHSHRMERLVKDLLRLTRLEAGQEPLDRVPCAVQGLFDGVVHDLDPVIEARRQHVESEVADDAGSLVADPAKLHDVLRNLVENAANYSPEDTTIRLTSRRAGDRLVFEISDEGPGIPEADLQRIFERFYRVDKARSRETGGTGLGLSIVKHLVGLHGGDVRALNRPGGGATFQVRLPIGK